MLTSHRYTSLRTGHTTEEVKNSIATSRNDLAIVARQNTGEIARVNQSLEDLSLSDITPANDDEEDDRIGAEAQLAEQKAALELCQNLYAHLQSMLQEEKMEKLAADKGSKTTVSFGSITGGIGIGVSNAPISGLTFGNSTSSTSKKDG